MIHACSFTKAFKEVIEFWP
uniref:Uncharacterized protein n=2 Tax=Salix viminalis TaxID=40686 RepID=A0A6N2K3F9_SALVM